MKSSARVHVTRGTAWLVAALSVVAFSAESALAQNFAQADLPLEASCPRDGQPGLIPGLVASLTTSGRPVFVSYVVGFISSPQGVIHLTSVIDGLNADQLDRAIGDFLGSGQSDTIAFSRVYALQKGAHTFALAFSCQSAIQVTQGWLTVYELPKQGHREAERDKHATDQ
jgi:hypothetical protein